LTLPVPPRVRRRLLAKMLVAEKRRAEIDKRPKACRQKFAM
jgi:hypothetical protein